MRRHSLIPLMALLSFTFVGCQQNELTTSKELDSIPVTVTLPTIGDITVYLESIGILQPSVLMEIRPQTSGPLTDIFIKEGQIVKQGDPLFKIDSQPYEIKVREAEALLAIDQAGLKAVQKKMARYKDLAERNLVAQTEWDELKAQLKKGQASVDLDSARLSFAKLELERCLLISPLDGRVGKLDASKGLMVASLQLTPLATISQLDPLIVEFTVTEKEFSLLPKEDLQIKMQSLCSSDSEEGIEGTITFLDNHFDAKTGLLLVRGKVENQAHSLRPGQSVQIQVPISIEKQAMLIPQKAIRYNQQGPYVYVVNDEMVVAIKQLHLGKEHANDQIILEGLDPTERIVLDGHLRLSPGLKVDIKT